MCTTCRSDVERGGPTAGEPVRRGGSRSHCSAALGHDVIACPRCHEICQSEHGVWQSWLACGHTIITVEYQIELQADAELESDVHRNCAVVVISITLRHSSKAHTRPEWREADQDQVCRISEHAGTGTAYTCAQPQNTKRSSTSCNTGAAVLSFLSGTTAGVGIGPSPGTSASDCS
jgi:hypothetical protein